ncbi:MAG TPA: bifunctional riboflavin kinase/FAD synthetase [Gemmatimonadaceae bacterium]|nr:bifunctional riboflavin kinase/FAD synthetase [Gemmatimonadaceae bacterium]
MSRKPESGDESGLPPDVAATAVTVGTFDGVHRGHRDVLAHLVQRARVDQLRSVLVTFDPHPLAVVNPTAAPPLLTVNEEKREVLAESGIDYCAVLPFTASLARYTAEQFVTRVLLNRFRMQCLLMGFDHGFGRNRSGDVHVMRALGARHGFRVEVLPPVSSDEGLPISSTAIRRAVAGGDLDRAALALGRPYSVSSRVVPGAQRGRGMGFPTINLAPPPARKLLPPQGVYAVRVQTPDGAFGGMMNLGPRPTFGEPDVTLEAHLFDADGDWYDRWVRVDFVRRLRETRRFSGPEALRAQLARDEADARRALDRPARGIADDTTSSVDASSSSP